MSQNNVHWISKLYCNLNTNVSWESAYPGLVFGVRAVTNSILSLHSILFDYVERCKSTHYVLCSRFHVTSLIDLSLIALTMQNFQAISPFVKYLLCGRPCAICFASIPCVILKTLYGSHWLFICLKVRNLRKDEVSWVHHLKKVM